MPALGFQEPRSTIESLSRLRDRCFVRRWPPALPRPSVPARRGGVPRRPRRDPLVPAEGAPVPPLLPVDVGPLPGLALVLTRGLLPPLLASRSWRLIARPQTSQLTWW